MLALLSYQRTKTNQTNVDSMAMQSYLLFIQYQEKQQQKHAICISRVCLYQGLVVCLSQRVGGNSTPPQSSIKQLTLVTPLAKFTFVFCGGLINGGALFDSWLWFLDGLFICYHMRAADRFGCKQSRLLNEIKYDFFGANLYGFERGYDSLVTE